MSALSDYGGYVLHTVFYVQVCQPVSSHIRRALPFLQTKYAASGENPKHSAGPSGPIFFLPPFQQQTVKRSLPSKERAPHQPKTQKIRPRLELLMAKWSDQIQTPTETGGEKIIRDTKSCFSSSGFGVYACGQAGRCFPNPGR